eukprot:3001711-Amphidinium_carterae.1
MEACFLTMTWRRAVFGARVLSKSYNFNLDSSIAAFRESDCQTTQRVNGNISASELQRDCHFEFADLCKAAN